MEENNTVNNLYFEKLNRFLVSYINDSKKMIVDYHHILVKSRSLDVDSHVVDIYVNEFVTFCDSVKHDLVENFKRVFTSKEVENMRLIILDMLTNTIDSIKERMTSDYGYNEETTHSSIPKNVTVITVDAADTNDLAELEREMKKLEADKIRLELEKKKFLFEREKAEFERSKKRLQSDNHFKPNKRTISDSTNKNQSLSVCKFGKLCKNTSCKRIHSLSEKCRYGKNCTRGKSCIYRHDTDNTDNTNDTDNDSHDIVKTGSGNKPISDAEKIHCRYGKYCISSLCQRLHSEERFIDSVPADELKKIECRFYRSDSCKLKDCPFKHKAKQTRSTVKCKFGDKCKFGKKCRFTH